MKIYKDLFNKIISPENLFSAWDEFKKGKRDRKDVMIFEHDLERNIFNLYDDLKSKRYKHGPYAGFYIHDPKLRHIHKATVRDRILHHAVYSVLNEIFEPMFISDSFSCRIGKGTHKGVDRMEEMLRKVSRNNTEICYGLKCDVQKFFNSVDHRILLSILEKRIRDNDTMWLLEQIVKSFESDRSVLFFPKGVPIGNLTSQLFANVYMGEFDRFIKHALKVEFYVRYTDDFIIVSRDKAYLEDLIAPIQGFLKEKLELNLHPDKVSIRKYRQGIDFLGYLAFPHYRLLRKKTKRRIERKIERGLMACNAGLITREELDQSFQSYLGVLSHANAHGLTEELKNKYWFWLSQ
jgi:retron-type reverse transcriptase